jgi:hypothetical protein
MNWELQAHGATITSSSTYRGHFNCSTFNSRSIRSRDGARSDGISKPIAMRQV